MYNFYNWRRIGMEKRKELTYFRTKLRIRKVSIGSVILYSLMLLLVAFTSLPLIYLISTAFKPLDELFLYPPRFFVIKPTMQNFFDLLTALSGSTVPFLRYVFNSLFTTAATVFFTILVSSMGAFSLVKYKPAGAKTIFAFILAALMFSPHVTQIPNYMVVNKIGLINSYWSLIIPKIAVAYNFFLMKQFSEQIPEALLEAARIDGAGEFKLFWKIAMPLLKPAWSTLVVFAFISNWNDFFSPLIYITSQSMKTLPVAMHTISGGAGVVARAGALGAAALLTTAPTIIIYVIMKGRVMQTMTHSGIKA
jgi:ABC-type glycerol-3-phosphate transport system permease component